MRITPCFAFAGLVLAFTACDVDRVTFGDTAGTLHSRGNPWLETGRSTYTAWYGPGTVEIDVDFTYHNRGRSTVAIPRCTGPHRPALDKLVGGEWVEVFSPPAACWDRPILVGPGRTENFSFRIRAGWGGTSGEPPLRTTHVPGTYRLRWDVYEHDTFSQFGIGALLPLVQRVSNTFRIEHRA